MLLVAALVPLACHAEERFTGRCVAVGDGDSFKVLRSGCEVRVRLHGVDCPELQQDFGQRARKHTSELVFGKDVTVEVVTRDVHDRLVAHVSVDGQDLGLALVQAGMAWHFTRYSDDPSLAAAEREARAAKRGLWQQPDPVPPWEYREKNGTGRRPLIPSQPSQAGEGSAPTEEDPSLPRPP